MRARSRVGWCERARARVWVGVSVRAPARARAPVRVWVGVSVRARLCACWWVCARPWVGGCEHVRRARERVRAWGGGGGGLYDLYFYILLRNL